ncbi:MAG: substrate-binding protein [candidate division Zixibacteria bacterium]|jgi:ABC-type branched-subunit amino acid transport system substrate-binding protein|nr:substrate-binding protein [candidate division Zixibacteria bacterium]
MVRFRTLIAVGLYLVLAGQLSFGSETVKIGLNYPETGPYSVQGLDQFRAATLAVEEINAAGGILGKQVELVVRDSKSNPEVSVQNVYDLIDNHQVKMIFGGASSGVAVAVGGVCQQKGVPFFGTLTYSTEITGSKAHRYTFRECYDSWMAAKTIAEYLTTAYAGKKYMYITADYTWGWTTEASVRRFTGTEDAYEHKGVLTPLSTKDFSKQLALAQMLKPDVLVLVLFGQDMVNAIRQATNLGLKTTCQIVVPNLTLGMAEGGGPQVMEGVIGALPWTWQVPYKYNYARGMKFVDTYAAKYGRYPSTSGASAYTIMYEYKAAVERAGSFTAPKVVAALEGHTYQLIKDAQTWREFDHQSVQTVYAVKCKAQADVLKDKYHLDYFEIISSMPGEKAAVSKAEWQQMRRQNNLALELEPLKTVAAE